MPCRIWCPMIILETSGNRDLLSIRRSILPREVILPRLSFLKKYVEQKRYRQLIRIPHLNTSPRWSWWKRTISSKFIIKWKKTSPRPLRFWVSTVIPFAKKLNLMGLNKGTFPGEFTSIFRHTFFASFLKQTWNIDCNKIHHCNKIPHFFLNIWIYLDIIKFQIPAAQFCRSSRSRSNYS